MGGWARDSYGDPCRECGYRWTMAQEAAVAIVAAAPRAYGELVGGADGSERHASLMWPVVGYVCHVGDNLRIWAERLAGVALGAPATVAAYDETLLARARVYDGVALPGALWSLTQAVAQWRDAVALAAQGDVTLIHPERGAMSLGDVVRSNAHDVAHHRWDIARSLR